MLLVTPVQIVPFDSQKELHVTGLFRSYGSVGSTVKHVKPPPCTTAPMPDDLSAVKADAETSASNKTGMMK